jgi:glyceraldehyde 3-phosphate dehydrogenase
VSAKIAINGFGRIGRSVARILAARKDDLEIVAINDLADAETLAHLLAFDSVHGHYRGTVTAESGAIVIDGTRIPVLAERNPAALPWRDLGVDVVLESTGRFTKRAELEQHIAAGAKRVVLSAPSKDALDATLCVGINHDTYDPAKHRLVSNASCTTNCLAPIARVLEDSFGLIKGHMLTVHAYTNDQSILDQPHGDLRRARAAAVSMIPTSTGAAKAIGDVIPELKGRLTGNAVRVPTPDVSITCLTAHVEKPTTAAAVNEAFRKAAAGGKLAGILHVEDRPLVSIDFVGNPYSSIVDSALTAVIGDDLVQVQAWYDNEWGFSNRMVDLATYVTKREV